ncbi:MAG: ATP-binding protein, partial [Candidatus Nanopelagicales bacterium]
AGPGRASAVLLGHTLDDQAETVLLALARGSGSRSLSGMAARSGVYRRPLLGLPREIVARAAAAAAAADSRLEPWSDPHNLDLGLRRVRVRRLALPALVEAVGPGVVAALARTARLARDDADALDGWADTVWASLPPATSPLGTSPTAEASLRLDGPTKGLPRAVVTRIVRRFLLSAGCPAEALTAEHVWAVTALLDDPPSGAEVALPGGRRARRVAASVVVRA